MTATKPGGMELRTDEASVKYKHFRWSLLVLGVLLSAGILVAVKKVASSFSHLRSSDVQEVKLLRFGKEGKIIPVRHYRHAKDQTEIIEIVQMLNDCRISETSYETTPETVIEIKMNDGGNIMVWDPFSEFVTVGIKLPGETYRQVEVTSLKPPIFLQAALNESGPGGDAQGIR